jgi:IS5 family transposase
VAVRSFVRLALSEAAPDHSTISRTRRLIEVDTHRAVFTWVQQRLVEAGLLKGKTVAIRAFGTAQRFQPTPQPHQQVRRLPALYSIAT